MRLRKLEDKDAKFMLEWMHDTSVVSHLSANFNAKTLEDCFEFIRHSQNSKTDLNMAIVDNQDNYMGTVSLKHIDYEVGTAEFAIVLRKEAMGKGYSKYGMQEIIRIGFEDLHLEEIIWCVSSANGRAVSFYEKNGYSQLDNVNSFYKKYYTEEQLNVLIWYGVRK